MKIKKVNEFGSRNFGGIGFGDEMGGWGRQQHRFHRIPRNFDMDKLVNALEDIAENMGNAYEDKSGKYSFDIAEGEKFICATGRRGEIRGGCAQRAYILYSKTGGLNKKAFYDAVLGDSLKIDFDFFIDVDDHGLAMIKTPNSSFQADLFSICGILMIIHEIFHKLYKGFDKTQDFKKANKDMEDQEDTKTWDNYHYIKKFNSL